MMYSQKINTDVKFYWYVSDEIASCSFTMFSACNRRGLSIIWPLYSKAPCHQKKRKKKCESDRYDLFHEITSLLIVKLTHSTLHTCIVLILLWGLGTLYKQAGYQFTLPDFWWSWKASMSPVAHFTLSGEGEKACLTTGTWLGWITCFPV